VTLRFTRLSPGARGPSAPRGGDAGYDLHAIDQVLLAPGERVSVGTGLAVAIPAGHAGLVLPRSGLALRHGIALVNAPGLIDPTFRGELRVLLLNTDARAAFRVGPGDRVAQLLLVPFAVPALEEAPALEATVRGAGGFGSTGR
jgi:dUTP pyrophosphatase